MDAAVRVGPRSIANSADSFDGALRSKIPRVDEEDNAFDELEGVPEHEAFHFAVEGASPL